MTNRICLIILFYLARLSNLGATTYYVNDGFPAGDIFCVVSGTVYTGVNSAGRGLSPSTPVLTLRYLFSQYSGSFASGDTIKIDAGTYSVTGFAATDEANFIVTVSGLTFKGAGVGKTIFDHNLHGSNADYFMWIKANNITVTEMTVREYSGGASSAGVTVASVNTGGQAFTIGTGTSSISGILINNVQTYNNSGTGNAAISIQPMTTATITGGGSTCNAFGGPYAGGIDVYGTAINLTIKNYLMTYNSKNSGFFGGGLYTYAADNTTIVNVSKTRVYSNTTSSDGGGMCFRGGNITIRECLIDSNKATGTYGGGIYITSGTLKVSNSKFSKNSGPKGGAICVNASEGNVNLTVDTCIFQSNTVLGYSDIYVRRNGSLGYTANLTVKDCQFLSTGSGTNYNIFNYDGASPIASGAANSFNVSYFGTAPYSGGVALTSNILSTNTPSYTPSLSLPTFSGPCGSFLILPIELTRFNGDCNNGEVILTWQTASEKNNKEFSIERSLDGINFFKIGLVKGSGNSEAFNNYIFTDTEKIEGLTYYRLNQIDYIGKLSQSKIISVEHNCGINNDLEILIYPNPTLNNTVMSLKLMKQSSVNIEIYNGIGQLVKLTTNQIYGPGLQELNLETIELPTGVYFIKTIVDDKEYIKKIIKL